MDNKEIDNNQNSNGKTVKSILLKSIKLVSIALVLALAVVVGSLFYFGYIPEEWSNSADKYSIETINQINRCEKMYKNEVNIDGIAFTMYDSRHINDVPNEYVRYAVCKNTRNAKKLLKHYEDMLCDEHASGENYVEGHVADTLDAEVEFYARRNGRMIIMTDASYQIFYDSEDTDSVDEFNKALKERYELSKEFIEKNY